MDQSKKKTRPHDEAAKRTRVEVSGSINEQGTPYINLLINGGIAATLDVVAALHMVEALHQTVGTLSADGILLQYMLARPLMEGETQHEKQLGALRFVADMQTYRTDLLNRMQAMAQAARHRPTGADAEVAQE